MTTSPQIAALVLNMGEPSLPDALNSLSRQTYPVSEVVRVDHVSPFHRALGHGVARVSAPYFIQVDVDMILDPDCIARLAASMAPSVAVAVGWLRDPLLGPVPGVKLFRTELVRKVPFRDVVSPDTDFMSRVQQLGWGVEVVKDPRSGSPDTLGDHRPRYDEPGYTFYKFRLEGSRYRTRGEVAPFRWYVRNLSASRHPSRYWALAGLAAGFFEPMTTDSLQPFSPDHRVNVLREAFANRPLCALPTPFGWGVGAFAGVYRRCKEYPEAATCFLGKPAEGPFDWLATLAAARALLSDRVLDDTAALKTFLCTGLLETCRQWYWWSKF